MCLATVHPPVTVQVILQLGACSQPGMEASVSAPSAVPSPPGFSWGQGYRQSCQFTTRDPLSGPNSSAPHGGEVPAFCTTLALLLTENLLLTVKFLHYLFFFFFLKCPHCTEFSFSFFFFHRPWTHLITLCASVSHKFPVSPGFKSYLQQISYLKYYILLVAVCPTVSRLPTTQHLLSSLLLQGSSHYQPEVTGHYTGTGAACGHQHVLQPWVAQQISTRRRAGSENPSWLEMARCGFWAASCWAMW